ncbi:MAG: TolC family protein [bacterium]|nr:TolC family protein [bacterium]
MALKLSAIITVIFAMSLTPLLGQTMEKPVLTLEQCLNLAFDHNPQLQSYQAAVEEAAARTVEVRSGFYPSVNFNAAAGRYESEDKTGSRDNYQATFSARYPVFQGFRTSASYKAADANYKANQSQFLQEKSDLRLKVTEAYYRLLQAERLVQVAEQSLKRGQLHLDFANARFNAGLASRSDVLKTKVELSNTNLALIVARNAKLAAAGKLNVLLGRPAHSSIEIKDDLEGRTFSVFIDSVALRQNVDWLIEAAFRSRPDLRKIEQQLVTQQAALRIARSDYFPTLSLEANYSYSGEATSDLQGSSYIGANISLPLFSGFSRPAQVAQEKWALQSLSQQQQAVRHQVSLEVWNAFLEIKQASERIVDSQIFYENSLENLHISEGEYREGVGSMLDVIDAQTALVTAEKSHIEALADYQIALAALARAVGRDDIEEILK